MKKSIIIPTVFAGIIGGYALAQNELFSSAAEKTSTITSAQAKEAALKAFNGKIIEFEYDHDDLVPHYDFEIAGSTEKVDLEVDAATGAVTITERKAVKNTAQPAVQQTIELTQNSAAKKTATITAVQAKEAALKAFNGKIVEFEYDSDNLVPNYDFEIVGSTEKVDLEVDATTGAVTITERTAVKNTTQQALEKAEKQAEAKITNTQTAQTAAQQATDQAQKPAASKTNEPQAAAKTPATSQQATAPKTPAPVQQTSGIITKAQAIAIAQQKATGTVTKAKFDQDDNEYEIEIVNGQIEYEFDIDATTGTIISFEEDIED